jgi:hypothetical protein
MDEMKIDQDVRRFEDTLEALRESERRHPGNVFGFGLGAGKTEDDIRALEEMRDRSYCLTRNARVVRNSPWRESKPRD